MSEDGSTEIEKLAPPVDTVSVTVVLCWTPPPLPVTVIGYVPAGVVDPTVMVIPELPEPGAGMVCGLKVTLVPEGTPEAERAIALLKPPLTVVVIVDAPWNPWEIVTEAGDADIVKVGPCWITVRVNVVFCCIPPPLPVTVMG